VLPGVRNHYLPDTKMDGISHDWNDEILEAKARWFQSLTLQERMDTTWSR
jgi:hypothetical protein